jgi:hypothetical protein
MPLETAEEYYAANELGTHPGEIIESAFGRPVGRGSGSDAPGAPRGAFGGETVVGVPPATADPPIVLARPAAETGLEPAYAAGSTLPLGMSTAPTDRAERLPLLQPVAKVPRQAQRPRRSKRPSFHGPRLADQIGFWRRLRSVVELVVTTAVLGAIVAGVVAAIVAAIVLALQNALG